MVMIKRYKLLTSHHQSLSLFFIHLPCTVPLTAFSATSITPHNIFHPLQPACTSSSLVHILCCPGPLNPPPSPSPYQQPQLQYFPPQLLQEPLLCSAFKTLLLNTPSVLQNLNHQFQDPSSHPLKTSLTRALFHLPTIFLTFPLRTKCQTCE